MSDRQPHASVAVPINASFWRKLWAFSGPGMMIAVGYMDPGNWATDLEGGAKFGYTLLSVVLLSNLMAILLQHLSLKLGVVSGRDLAQACRDHYSRPVTLVLWALCEIAISACDLAEVIGSAIALNLLFGIPLVWGILLTALDVFVVLFFQSRNFRLLELFITLLVLLVGACFAYEIVISHPSLPMIMKNLVPSMELVRHPEMLYLAVGILGATVMPHNLYLHSSIVQTRAYVRSETGKRTAIRFASIDLCLALGLAFLVNAAILILSASAFHTSGHEGVADISVAYHLLSPVLASPHASLLFAVALLASGHNSTVTGTLAGQIVMEGFLDLRLKPWLRRLLTRSAAIIPAMIVAIYYGARGITVLLVLSQVILSFQLIFAVVPLIQFTSSTKTMGIFANGRFLRGISWITAAVILFLNTYLIVRILFH